MGSLEILNNGIVSLSSDMELKSLDPSASYGYVDWVSSFFNNRELIAEELKNKKYTQGDKKGFLMYPVEFDFNLNSNFLKILNSLDGSNPLNYRFNYFLTKEEKKHKAYIAYMLATFKHETGGGDGSYLYSPVREAYYVGVGTEAWKRYLRSKTNYEGGTYPVGHPYVGVPIYYGRGLVQITHDENYKKFTKILKAKIPGFNKDFILNPDEVLDFDISMAISLEGMVEGKFTTRGFKHIWKKYSNDLPKFFYECRTIINSYDEAIQIAEYALDFYSLFVTKETQ